MFRCERLEEQLNDLTELHQNEILNLKQELASMEEKIAYQSYERARDIQVCVGLMNKVLLKRNKNPPIQDESIIQDSLFLLSHPVFQLVISDMKPSLQMNSEGGDKKKISLKYECNQPERGSSVFFSSNVVFGFFIRK